MKRRTPDKTNTYRLWIWYRSNTVPLSDRGVSGDAFLESTEGLYMCFPCEWRN